MLQLKTQLPTEDLQALSKAMGEYELKLREKDQLIADLLQKWNDTTDELLGQDSKKCKARLGRRVAELEQCLKEADNHKPVWDKLNELAEKLVKVDEAIAANQDKPGQPLSEAEYRQMVLGGIGGGGLSAYWANRLLLTLTLARNDVVMASHELLVDMDEAPIGSTTCRLLIANSLMRQDRDRYRKALQDCARHSINFDTCGVCGQHFDDCESDRAVADEDQPFTDENTFPACPGARARALLARTGP